jgi:hypothetical protein
VKPSAYPPFRFSPVFVLLVLFLCGTASAISPYIDRQAQRIRPYEANPAYWQYRGQPVLLLGTSSEDNLFQYPQEILDAELDLIVENGGNYVRNTMSSRDPGNVYAFFKDSESGLYDLNRWDNEYWRRFEYFLEATRRRDIIVQVEIWATYDYYTRISHLMDGLHAWERNPFHPDRNMNYTTEESGMPVIFRSNGYSIINPFFSTVLPLFDETPLVLGFQQKFVDKLLSISLNFDHVLYCIDNETNADPGWPLYWSDYIKTGAKEINVGIEVTGMWDTFDPTDGAIEAAAKAARVVQSPSTHFFTKRSGVSNTLYNPESYSFLDISNHNAQAGELHYQTGLYIWNKVQESGIIRPVNNVKIYGTGDISGTWSGSERDALERFWRNIFAGAASVRFHRPGAGIGTSESALAHLKSMRMLTGAFDIFNSRPANHLLGERSENEAYCLAGSDDSYILYFPSGGNVRLDARPGQYETRWLDICTSAWQPAETTRLPGTLTAPDNGHRAVLIKKLF